MCRHLAYLGPPISVHDLLYAPPHSLEHQSYAAELCGHGALNADGFGIGWYPAASARPLPAGAGGWSGAGEEAAGPSEAPSQASAVAQGLGRPDPALRPGPATSRSALNPGSATTAARGSDERPVRYRRSMPIWADASFADIAPVISVTCAVAAVRSATPGFPVEESGAQPFVAGHRLFSHNGRIEGFAGVEARLRARALEALGDDPAAVPDARAPLDSAALLALAVGYWRAGATLGDGLAEVVAEVGALGGTAGTRLNLLAADGSALAATTYGDSLFVRDDRDHGGPAVLASEPYDDAPSWRRLPDRSLVAVDATGVTITAIKEI